MRLPISSDVDPVTLAEQLTTALGTPIAVSVRNPGQVGDKGDRLPGVVLLLDGGTGRPLRDQDQAEAAAVIAAHAVPQPAKSPAKALADGLRNASTAADLKAALAAFADALVAREDRTRPRRGG